jgi:hypothetical protein
VDVFSWFGFRGLILVGKFSWMGGFVGWLWCVCSRGGDRVDGFS